MYPSIALMNQIPTIRQNVAVSSFGLWSKGIFKQVFNSEHGSNLVQGFICFK